MSTSKTERQIQELESLCLQRGLTVGLAESCTGGLLSSWICQRAGVSKWFQGAIVSYSGRVKADVLGVEPSLLKVHGEVSLPVARAMAEGARSVLSCDWAVSITGIAGPGGGSLLKPVGTVCFAVVGPGVSRMRQEHFLVEGGRVEIQARSAELALTWLCQAMHGGTGFSASDKSPA